LILIIKFLDLNYWNFSKKKNFNWVWNAFFNSE